jgi:deazaflavin-dependent oxidoreductase (nitroreductase family)
MKPVLTVLGVLVLAVVALAVAFVVGMRTKTPLVLDAVRRTNRRFVNPRQLASAGTPGAYAGIIRHTGRRSGTAFETPVTPVPTPDGFVIALPYGTRADWLQNVLASGRATLVTEGRTWDVDRPEVVPTTAVEQHFPEKERRNLRFLRVDRCLVLRRLDPRS